MSLSAFEWESVGMHNNMAMNKQGVSFEIAWAASISGYENTVRMPPSIHVHQNQNYDIKSRSEISDTISCLQPDVLNALSPDMFA